MKDHIVGRLTSDHEDSDNGDDDCICGNDDNFHQKFSSLNRQGSTLKGWI